MARRAAPPPPSRHFPGAETIDSIVSGGCQIAGRVERSVLSPDVKVAKGAIVRNSVLWDGCVVEEGAIVDHVICDKRVVIGRGARVGVGDDFVPNSEHPESLVSGISVLGMDVHIPAATQVGRNCILHPCVGSDQLQDGPVPSGATIRSPNH